MYTLKMKPVSVRCARFIFSIVCLSVSSALCASDIFATATTKTDLQVEIISQEYSTSSSTANPTDNSLGIMLWDENKYNDETVYFEAIIRCDSCSGGNAEVDATLYSDTGSAVTGATVSTTSSTFTRIRSADITSNLTDDEEYTIRIAADTSSGTAYIQSARLIILQSGAKITDLQNQIEIGENDTTTNTSYELIANPKVYLYDENRHSDVVDIFFEATLQGSDGSAVAYAALSNSTTCSTTVSGTEVSITGTTWGRNRSADIESNLTDDTQYWVCIRTTSADTGAISSAKIIVEQSDSTEQLEDIELVYTHVNQGKTDTDSTYTSQEFDQSFDPAIVEANTIDYWYEATLKTNAGTAYARLYNVSDTIAISGSEVSTTATTFARIRSSQLHINMPSSAKFFDAQIKNSGSNTTTVSNSWLIAHFNEIPDPELSFTLALVAANQVNNQITTSVASTITTLPFGNVTVGIPKYIAHSLTASTNAPSGYDVSIKMQNYMQGDYPGNNIDPFISIWGTPTTWTQPTGSTPSVDTGWIGANTTDTRVTGWSSAAQKFGPVNSSENQVMFSSTADEGGTTAFVTFAVETNILQPADYYTGTIQYNITPIY